MPLFALSRINRHAGAALTSLLALALVGCGSDEPAPVVQVKEVKKEQAVVDPTAKMARAVTIGKSTVPIELKYEIAAKPIVDAPIEIELALVPSTGADSIGVTFEGSPGLTLSSNTAPPIEVVKAKQVERVNITAMAKEENVYYLTVIATMYTAGTSEARTFAVPLIVSAPPPPKAESAEPAEAAAPAEEKKS